MKLLLRVSKKCTVFDVIMASDCDDDVRKDEERSQENQRKLKTKLLADREDFRIKFKLKKEDLHKIISSLKDKTK